LLGTRLSQIALDDCAKVRRIEGLLDVLITGVTIRAAWLDPIVARLERDGFVPVVYEPPALLSGDLSQAAQDLSSVVDRVRANSGLDKIDILAECTGGVIARYYIQSLGGDQFVSRLVTFVSPQHGLSIAPLAASLVGWPALHDLSPGSDFLNAVNGAALPPGVAVTSIYTCTDEYIQPYQTSIIPGATNIGLCDGFVGHFQTMYDPSIYLIMHDALLK
jgi:triacylglycerol lipase